MRRYLTRGDRGFPTHDRWETVALLPEESINSVVVVRSYSFCAGGLGRASSSFPVSTCHPRPNTRVSARFQNDTNNNNKIAGGEEEPSNEQKKIGKAPPSMTRTYLLKLLLVLVQKISPIAEPDQPREDWPIQSSYQITMISSDTSHHA